MQRYTRKSTQIKQKQIKQIKQKQIKRHIQKTSKCSPAVEGKTIQSSCYTKDVLQKICGAYNQKHPTEPILCRIPPNDLWKQLKQRLQTSPDCWMNELPVSLKQSIKKYIFKPKQPPEWKRNHKAWLSNIDILNVLKQFEEKTPTFCFIGPTSIDFDAKPANFGGSCVEQELCQFSLQKMKERGNTSVGIIFNLDRHDQKGSHWVSMFIDIFEPTIYFFDSAGSCKEDGHMPDEIRIFKERILKEANDANIQEQKQKPPQQEQKEQLLEKHPNKMKYMTNSIRHQRGGSECGMYSLYFIICMLNSKHRRNTFNEIFNTKRISDETVESYRDIYFDLQ